ERERERERERARERGRKRERDIRELRRAGKGEVAQCGGSGAEVSLFGMRLFDVVSCGVFGKGRGIEGAAWHRQPHLSPLTPPSTTMMTTTTHTRTHTHTHSL